jgi:DNA transposition AAA+ family ATPase
MGNPFLFERRRQLRSCVRLNPRAREKLQKTVAAWRVALKALNRCVAFCDQI